MPTRSKYLRVTDLYVDGTEFVLKDGTVMWLQIPNPFEYDEARHDAAVARSRLTLALKTHGHDELTKVRGSFLAKGTAGAVDIMVDAKGSEFLIKAYDDIREDPDWRERADMVDRGDEILARAPEDVERLLLIDVGAEYSAEISRRITEQADDLRSHLSGLSEDDLWDEFQDFYLERRGGELGLAEFKLTELWYAARCCDAVMSGGSWDHGACEGHTVHVFETKADVRALPEDLQRQLVDTLAQVAMTERAAKDSARQRSSSAPSPLPNEEAASTPSTPAVTPGEAPGISSTPLPTPSLSSVGSS